MGTVYFAGTNAGIYRSTDQGGNWTNVDPSFTLCFLVEGTKIFAGTSSGVIISMDGGKTWIHPNSEMNYYINDLAIEDGFVFAGTDGHGIFRSANDGKNWVSINNGLEQYQYFVNSITAYGKKLLAATRAGVVMSGDDGNNWSIFESDTGNQNNCVAVTDSTIFIGTSDGIYRSINNSPNFKKSDNGLPENSSTFSIVANKSYVFAGTVSGIYRSSDNGENWDPITDDLPGFPYYLTASDSNLYVGTRNGLFMSTDNGTNWVSASNGIVASTVTSIAGSGPYVFAVISNRLFISSDEGMTWIGIDRGLPKTVQSIYVIDSKLYALTNNGVYVSSDYGDTWEAINGGILNNKFPTRLLKSGSNLVVTLLNGGVYFSSNNGTSWNISGGNLQHPLSMTTLGTKIFSGSHNSFFESDDHGENWREQNSTLTDINTLTSLGSTIYAGRSQSNSTLETSQPQSGAFWSTDNGRTWFPFNSGLPLNPQIYSLFTFEPYIFASIPQGLYYISINGDNWINNNWININTGLPSLEVMSVYKDNTHIFAGMQNGGIWMRSVSDLEKDTTSVPLPSKVILSQNYPNPFNPTTVIKYSLPKQSKVILKVYDILGREILILVNKEQNEGIHSVIFNASGLSSGLYFYQLIAGNSLETKKMILIK